MSFVITMYVREGVVMASDSRMTLSAQKQSADGQSVQQLAVGQTDVDVGRVVREGVARGIL